LKTSLSENILPITCLKADYENGEWKNVEIKPYQPLVLEPSYLHCITGKRSLKE
jgi:hypothetical protein